MTLARQEKEELEIFSQFMTVALLPVLPDSTEKRDPPEPDILCQVEGRGPVAFEMVELIDQSLARRTFDQIKLIEALYTSCEDLPVVESSRMQENLGNAFVNCAFAGHASFRMRKAAIPFILHRLQEIPSDFEGQVEVKGKEGSGVDTKVTIRRGNLVGPCFNVVSGGSFSDPTLNRIRQKIEEKSYKTSAPIELLGYYELQPVLSDSIWLPRVTDYVRQNVQNSQFRRIWIFDVRRNQLKVIYPQQKQ